MSMRGQSQTGFTLIEAVVAIVVLGLLTVAAMPMLENALRAYQATNNSVAILGKLRYATERLARELREVRHNGASYDLNMSATAPVFTRVDGATTRVVTVAQGGGAVTLSYDTPAVNPAPILTDELGTLSFSYFDQDGVATASSVAVRSVEIYLALVRGGATYEQRTRVALRNSP